MLFNNKMDNIIKAGHTVVIKMHDDKSTSLIKVQGEQKICRSKVSTKQLVGAPYGSVFQITTDHKLVLVKDNDELDVEADEDIIDSSTMEVVDENLMIVDEILKGDNRGYIDSNTAQKLSTADIMKLRESGASGKEIIDALIANSDTWAGKTSFAQEKWLKRKQKKYIRCMRIVKTCPATVCEVYHAKNKDKICGLRWDSLAQILSGGGIRSGSRVLVFDSVLGLVVGSIAYRLRGNGVILAAYAGQQPHFEIVNTLNLDEHSQSTIQTIPSEELGPASVHVNKHGFGYECDEAAVETENDRNNNSNNGSNNRSDSTDNNSKNDSSSDSASSSSNTDSNTSSSGNVDTSSSCSSASSSSSISSYSSGVINASITVDIPAPKVYPPSKPHQSTGRQAEPLLRLRSELRKGVDSLIIASKYDPLPILKVSLNLLVPSSPFVVYCEFLEPLVECYMYVTENALAVKVSLSDTWAREFQTLPGRVHPQMFMSNSSGYILSGVYVGVPTIYNEKEIANNKSETKNIKNSNENKTDYKNENNDSDKGNNDNNKGKGNNKNSRSKEIPVAVKRPRRRL